MLAIRSRLASLLTLAVAPLLPFSVVASAQQPARYTGPGSCSSASCHGGVQPRSDNSVLQNEYTAWIVDDKHSRAFSVLTGDAGKRIGRNLNIQPATSDRCTGCHTLGVPDEQKTRSFDNNDGVSCENCHGAASNWLGPHTAKDANYEKSLAEGLYDTRDLIKRNEKCLSCHLGDDTKTVDHEMIAAGHPDLYFEIESFSAVMPRHWKEPFPNDPAIDVRGLAVGQAVQLREWMRRIGRDAQQNWPQYADLECFSCHHSLTDSKDSWRQETGFAGRKAGNPPFNASRFVVLDVIVRQIDPAGTRQLDAQVGRVNQLVSDAQADRAQIAQATSEAAATADRLAHELVTAPLDSAISLKLINAICADAQRISSGGERSAEQAAMAVNSLFIAWSRNKKSSGQDRMRGAIADLYKQFQNPSSYNPEVFARALHSAGAAAGGL